MRSSGHTNFGLLLSVVVLTKSRIACFAGPSFHDGNGSAAMVATGWPAVGVEGVGLLVHPARITISEIKSVDRKTARTFITFSPLCCRTCQRDLVLTPMALGRHDTSRKARKALPTSSFPTRAMRTSQARVFQATLTRVSHLPCRLPFASGCRRGCRSPVTAGAGTP